MVESIEGLDMGASGYAVVWATENTREAIVDALLRKEAYSTNGPRIVLSFFVASDFTDADADVVGETAEIGSERGGPMGGDLKLQGDMAPSFLVAGMKDPNGANLDRIQIVKVGWNRADLRRCSFR